MKSFLKLLLIFFSLTISLLLDPSALQINDIVQVSGAISHPEQETCVLVSNNILGGEIRSIEKENQSNFIGSSSLVASNLIPENSFSKNKAQFNGCFIHNLSTDKQNLHLIRAP